MKKIQLIPVIVFFLFVFYFAIFNWGIFIESVLVKLGFANLNIPVIMVLFIISIFFLFIQSSLSNIIEAKYTRQLDKKEKEITSVKSDLYDKSAPEMESIVANLGYLDEKIDKILEKLDVEPEKELPEKPEPDEEET